MYDIITFGSATWDVFLEPEKFKVVKAKKDFVTGKGICFNMGSKIDIKKMHFSSGGGGTNTAATFAKQGFNAAYCGTVGNDIDGEKIIEELGKLGINTELISRTEGKPTNHSIILSVSSSKEDRTVLTYRGASEMLNSTNIPWDKLTARWLYLAPLSGDLCGVFGELVNFAKKNNIKVAANPGNSQLGLPKEILNEIIKKIDVLILNQEEASLLTGIPYKKEGEIFKKIDELCPGIAIMTKGPEGVVVSDGKAIYSAKGVVTEVVDRTGAGDAFGSGFISGLIKTSGSIEYAVQLGLANATSCLKQWGAKNGLLTKGDQFTKPVVKKNLYENTKRLSKKSSKRKMGSWPV